MNNSSELGKKIKQIYETEAAISIQKQLCEKDPNSFAYKLSLNGLMAKRDELQAEANQLMLERAYESINLVKE